MYYLEASGVEAQEYPRSFAAFDLVRFIWRRKRYLLLTLPLAIALGAVAYQHWVPKYLSEAQVLVVKKSPQMIPGLDTQFAAMEDTLAIHAAVIRSPLLVGEAIREQGLESLPSLKSEEDVTETIIESLTVSPSWRISNQDSSALLNLAYISTHAEDSEIILNAILASYEDFLASLHRADSEQSAKLYKQWRDEVQSELAAKQQAFEELKKSDPLAISTPSDVDVARSRLDRADTARLSQSIRKTELENQLKTLEELRDQGASPAMLVELAERWRADSGSNHELGLRQRLIDLQLMEQTMLTKFGPRHPDLLALKRQIDLMQSREAMESGVESTGNPADFYVELMKRELDGLDKIEASLDQLVREERDRVETVAERRERVETLRSEIDRIQSLHTEIVKQVQGVDLVKESKTYQAQLITPPEVGEKVSPSLPVFAFVFAFLGLFSGAGLAVYAEATDQRVRSAGEVRHRLNVPVLGQIPKIPGYGRNPREFILHAFHSPDSATAEAYRRLRTALFFRDPHERCSLLQITSPESGDGTSTVAANLAVSIAQSGRSVLLIDANLRSPTLSGIFGLDSDQAGFAELLTGQAEADEVICRSEIPTLSVIPAGSSPMNPAEMFASPRLPELLQVAGTRFDYVIIDTPALMAVSDPGMVAPHVDGVLLTVNVSSSWPRVAQAKDMLDSLNVRVIGAAVNGISEFDRPVVHRHRIEQMSA